MITASKKTLLIGCIPHIYSTFCLRISTFSYADPKYPRDKRPNSRISSTSVSLVCGLAKDHIQIKRAEGLGAWLGHRHLLQEEKIYIVDILVTVRVSETQIGVGENPQYLQENINLLQIFLVILDHEMLFYYRNTYLLNIILVYIHNHTLFPSLNSVFSGALSQTPMIGSRLIHIPTLPCSPATASYSCYWPCA